MLELKPENRPNTQQILNMLEIQQKIIELNIYPLNKEIGIQNLTIELIVVNQDHIVFYFL